jgi:hypothetical protein
VCFVDYCMACFVCLSVAINGDRAAARKVAATNEGAPFIVHGEASNAQRNTSVHISEVRSCERVKHADACAVSTSEGNKRSTRCALISRTENLSSY